MEHRGQHHFHGAYDDGVAEAAAVECAAVVVAVDAVAGLFAPDVQVDDDFDY